MINYKKVDLLHRKNTQDTVLTEEQVQPGLTIKKRRLALSW